MRLIDADAVLEKAEKEREYLKARGLLGAEHILTKYVRNLVDDAPSVKERSYEMGYQDGCEDGLQGIRPKSEWIKMSDRYGVYFACKKCGYDRERAITNFCPNCGADMRGREDG